MDGLHRDFQRSMTLLASLDARAATSHAALLDAISTIANPATRKIEGAAESAQHRALDAARHVKFLRLNAIAETRFLADAASAAQRRVQHELAAVRARLGQSAAESHGVAESDSLEAIASEFDALLDAPENSANDYGVAPAAVAPAVSSTDTAKLSNGHKGNVASTTQVDRAGVEPVQTAAASSLASQAPSLTATPATPARLVFTNDITTSPLTPLPSDLDHDGVLGLTPAPTKPHSSTPDLHQPLDAAKSPEPEQEFFTPPPFAESSLLPEASITTNAPTNTTTKAPSVDTNDGFVAGKTNGHTRLPADSQTKSAPESSDTPPNAANVMKQIAADHAVSENATGPILAMEADNSGENQAEKPDAVTSQVSNQTENQQSNGSDVPASNVSARESNDIISSKDTHKNSPSRSVVEVADLEDTEPTSIPDVNRTTRTRAGNNLAKNSLVDLPSVDDAKLARVADNNSSGQAEPISQRRSRRTKPDEDAKKNPVSRAWQKLNELVGPHYASSFVKHRIERHQLPADVAFPIIEQAQSWEQLVEGLKSEVAKRLPGFNPDEKDEFDRVWEKRNRRKAVNKGHELEQKSKLEKTTVTAASKSKKNGSKNENVVSSSKEPSLGPDADQTPIHVPGKRGRPKGSTAENRKHKKQKKEPESGKSDEPEPVEVHVKDDNPQAKVKAKSTPTKSRPTRTTRQSDAKAVKEETPAEVESDNLSSAAIKTKPNTRSSTKSQAKPTPEPSPKPTPKPTSKSTPKSTPTASSKSNSKSKSKEKAEPETEPNNEFYEASDTLYCICQRPSFGQMVACDWEGCPYEWYHLLCLKMRRPPPQGKWYCPHCVELHGPPPTLEQEQAEEEARKRQEAEEQQKAAAARAKRSHKKAQRPINKTEPPAEPLRRSLRKR